MLDELLLVDPSSLDDDALRDHVVELGRLADRVEAARLAALGEWDVRAVWAYDGAASGAGWLAAQGNVARGAASASLRTARHLRTMPATREAVREGRLAPTKAKLLAGVINPRTEEAFARDEEVLVGEARHLTVDETAMLLRRWRLLADENGPRPADDHDADAAHCSQILNGRFRIDANLDTECGSIVSGVWDSIIEEMRHAAREGRGLLPSGPQLRADALVEMGRRASRAERGPGARPLIWIVAPRDTIPRVPSPGGPTTTPWPDPFDDAASTPWPTSFDDPASGSSAWPASFDDPTSGSSAWPASFDDPTSIHDSSPWRAAFDGPTSASGSSPDLASVDEPTSVYGSTHSSRPWPPTEVSHLGPPGPDTDDDPPSSSGSNSWPRPDGPRFGPAPPDPGPSVIPPHGGPGASGGDLSTAADALTIPPGTGRSIDPGLRAPAATDASLFDLDVPAAAGGSMPPVGLDLPGRGAPGSAMPGSVRGGCGLGTCEIPGAGPIPARDAVRIACDASISMVLTDELGRIVDVGRAQRSATTVQRRLLWSRDGGCTFPGCGRPPGWCEAHHLQYWEDGGPTDLTNLTLLCSFHHHLCHKGFGAERIDGRVIFTRPDGTLVVAPRVAA